MEEHEPEPIYANLAEFVENYLSLVYRRNVTTSRRVWCPQWWKHPEAVVRLDALWRAWEHLRIGTGPGMSVWFLDHADPHMSVLFDPQGPFEFCSVAKGHRDTMGPLPLREAPPEMFASAEKEEAE